MLSKFSVLLLCALGTVMASPAASASEDVSSVVTSTFTGTRVMPTVLSVEPFLASATSVVVWTETFNISSATASAA